MGWDTTGPQAFAIVCALNLLKEYIVGPSVHLYTINRLLSRKLKKNQLAYKHLQ